MLLLWLALVSHPVLVFALDTLYLIALGAIQAVMLSQSSSNFGLRSSKLEGSGDGCSFHSIQNRLPRSSFNLVSCTFFNLNSTWTWFGTCFVTRLGILPSMIGPAIVLVWKGSQSKSKRKAHDPWSGDSILLGTKLQIYCSQPLLHVQGGRFNPVWINKIEKEMGGVIVGDLFIM